MRKLLKIFFIISIVAPSFVYGGALKDSPVTSDMVEIEADRLDVNTQNGQAVFRGNVTATQGDILVKGATLTLFYDNTSQKVTSLIAENDVYVLWQDKEASCDKAVYNLDENRMELTGDVIITKGQERLSGQKVVVDMASDQQVVEGGGGRVKIRVNTQKESGILQWEK
jgi:lipopolysaccharide export system protein LptA